MRRYVRESGRVNQKLAKEADVVIEVKFGLPLMTERRAAFGAERGRDSMKYVSSFLIAFSMYSKIPVPQADWEKSSMEYVMCFFPLVGAVIGGILYGAAWAADFLLFPGSCRRPF